MTRCRATGFAASAALAAWVGWALLTAPPAATPLAPGEAPAFPLARGAYHVHSVESDGTGSIAEIGDAAARAGLDFVILTDHGDGTREVRPPRYYHGVLCIEAVEISTAHGHYVALGLPTAPYPLGGDGRDVAADVERLGGFGIAAHPDSAKRDLQWRDWDMPVRGMEWFNGDSQWRDEERWRLLPILVRYFRRPAASVASLFDRPDALLATWDRLTQQRSVVAMAGHDAHQRLGLRSGDEPGEQSLYLRAPSYEHVFRTFSLGVELPFPLRDDAAHDAAALLGAIRAGRVYTAIDAVAGPATFDFEARIGNATARMGDRVPLTGPVTFAARSNAPEGAVTALIHNGQVVARQPGGRVHHLTDRPGVYRVEIVAPGSPGHPPIPWILSNPIYVGMGEIRPEQPRPTWSAWAPTGGWRIEKDQGTTADLEPAAGGGFTLAFTLAKDTVSPFAAVVSTDVGPVAAGTSLSFQTWADRPMRASLQLRTADGGPDARWRRSFFADATPRQIVIPLAELAPVIDGLAAAVPIQRVRTFMFVVDVTNTRPGSVGRLHVDNLATGR